MSTGGEAGDRGARDRPLENAVNTALIGPSPIHHLFSSVYPPFLICDTADQKPAFCLKIIPSPKLYLLFSANGEMVM